MATISSPASATDSGELAADVWDLSDPNDPATRHDVAVAPGWAPAQHRNVGVFYPVDDDDGEARAVAVYGDQYGVESQLALRVLSEADYDAVKALLQSDVTLLLRSPWGQLFYIAVTTGVAETPMRAEPDAAEDFPLRHAHTLTATVVEVARP